MQLKIGACEEMSRVISERFKEEIASNGYTYERFCGEVGVSGKAVLANILNHREDKSWRYIEIKKWCDVLDVNIIKLLAEVKN